jgi:biotin carboxyl carrier protein
VFLISGTAVDRVRSPLAGKAPPHYDGAGTAGSITGLMMDLPRPAVLGRTTALLGFTMLALAACGKKQPKPETTPEAGYIIVKSEAVPLMVELAGRTSAFETSDVRPQVSGVVKARLFTEGSIVQKGQALYRIDPSLYRAAVNQAQANLQSAEANRESAVAKADRFKPLAKIQAVAEQDYVDAAAAARQSVAAVAQNRAALDTARINLAFTTVPAPITGRIGRSLVTTGALVTSGQADSLTSIQRLDPIYVDIQQSSTDLLTLRQQLATSGVVPSAATVKLKLENGATYAYAGKLDRIFIDRPIFAWVIAIITMLLGVAASSTLPIAQYPDIAPPQVNIRATYPGASAETVQNSVAQIIEQQLTGIDGCSISATSKLARQVQINLTFEKGTDPDIAQVQVQNKVQQGLPRLPQPVQQQGLRVTKSNPDFLLVVGVYDETDKVDHGRRRLCLQRCRIRSAACRAWATPTSSAPLCDAHLARPRAAASFNLMPSDVDHGDPERRIPDRRRRDRRPADADDADAQRDGHRPVAPADARSVRAIILKALPAARACCCRTSRASSWAARATTPHPRQRPSRLGIAISCAGRRRARRPPSRQAKVEAQMSPELPGRLCVRLCRTTPPISSSSRSRRW